MDRSEKRFGKKEEAKAETTTKDEAAATGTGDGQIPPDIKGLFDRLQKERQQTADRHDRERTQMHGRHVKDYKDLANRHEEEVQQALAAGGPGVTSGTSGIGAPLIGAK